MKKVYHRRAAFLAWLISVGLLAQPLSVCGAESSLAGDAAAQPSAYSLETAIGESPEELLFGSAGAYGTEDGDDVVDSAADDSVSSGTDSFASDGGDTDSAETGMDSPDSDSVDPDSVDAGTDSPASESGDPDSSDSGTDSEAVDSEAVDSEATDSEATDSETTDSEATDSEATDSETTDSPASDAQPADSAPLNPDSTDSELLDPTLVEESPLEAEMAAAAKLPDGIYTFTSALSSTLAMAIGGESMSAGGNVELKEAAGTFAEAFYLTSLGNGRYTIKSCLSGLYVEPKDGQTALRTNVQQGAASENENRIWLITESKTAGYYTITSALGAVVLDVSGGTAKAGANIQLWRSNGSAAQMWAITPDQGAASLEAGLVDATLPEGYYCLSPRDGQSFVSDIAGGSSQNGTNIRLWTRNGTKAQAVYLESLGGSQFRINSLLDKKVFDISGGKFADGQNVQLWRNNGSAAQSWTLKQNPADGSYVFCSGGAHLVLGTANDTTGKNVNICLSRFSGAAGQAWTLTPLAEADLYPLADGLYTIRNAGGSTVLDVASGSRSAGANIRLWSSNGTNAQKFYATCQDKERHIYTLRNINSRMYLSVAGGSTASGANAEQAAKSAGDEQLWEIVRENGNYLIRNLKSGLVLETAGGSADKAVNVQIGNKDSASTEYWIFGATKQAAPASGLYTIAVASAETMAIDIADGSQVNGANVRLWSGNGTNAQKFNLTANADGTYTILGAASGRAVDVVNASSANCANVWQYTDNGSGAQRWNLVPTGDSDGSYYIESALSGKVLDLANGSMTKGTNIWIYTRNGSAAQKFLLIPTSYNQNGWRTVSGKTYYYSSGKALTGWQQIKSSWYYFDKKGVMARSQVIGDWRVDANGVRHGIGVSADDTVNGVTTLTNYLHNALVPCGRTLYIWGGGHDDADSSKIGFLPGWATYFQQHATPSFNYDQHRWKTGMGLDCSGYVGWVTYNTIYKVNDQKWLAWGSTETAQHYIDYGWCYQQSRFLPGDIVSMNGHIWICLGECSDGTYVVLHCSPNGTQISGTGGKAYELAQYYMETYFPEWPYAARRVKPESYLKYVDKATWKVDGSGLLTDPDGIQKMSAEQVLKTLLGD